MTFARRLTLIVLGLLLVVLVTVVLLVPDLLVTVGANLAQISPIIRTALVIVANVLILALLYAQVRPAPRPNSSGLSVRASGAQADVSVESAKERILRAVRSVPNVDSAEAKVEAVNGKADIDMDVIVVGENVNVPKKQQEIDRTLRQVTLKQLGLQFASRPRVHIQLASEAAPIARPDLTPSQPRSFAERVAPLPREEPPGQPPRDEPVITRPEPVIAPPSIAIDDERMVTPPPAPPDVESEPAEPDFLSRRELFGADDESQAESEFPVSSTDLGSAGLSDDEDGERREEDRPKPPEDTAL